MSNHADDLPESKRIRLSMRNTMPNLEALEFLLTESGKEPASLVEMPWRTEGSKQTFTLTVKRLSAGPGETWTLYRGDGPGSEVIWSSTETDLPWIHDVLHMAVSTDQSDKSSSTPSGAYAEPPAVGNIDPSFLKKNANVLLGQILVDAGLVPDTCLEAALDLQEKVRSGALTPESATDALRRTHKELLASEAEGRPASKKQIEEIRRGLALLKQAGLLTEADIQQAVLARHGADICQLLVSHGKVDVNTFEAALTCQALMDEGRVDEAQAIIALHYCHRSRVGLYDALQAIGNTQI